MENDLISMERIVAWSPRGDWVTFRSDIAGFVSVHMDDPESQSEEGEPDPQPDESMDGDHDSAMASAGLGTDEDYGHFGGDEYDGGDYPSSDCGCPLADED